MTVVRKAAIGTLEAGAGTPQTRTVRSCEVPTLAELPRGADRLVRPLVTRAASSENQPEPRPQGVAHERPRPFAPLYKRGEVAGRGF